MRIQCTKKLLEWLHNQVIGQIEKQEETDALDFFSWHANIITVDRHKVLLFVNNSNRLTVIVSRPKAAVYKQLNKYLEAGIRELFSKLGVRPQVIDLYLQKAGAVYITPSGTRSQISRMNKIADEVCWQSSFFRDDQMLQTAVSVALAEFPESEGKRNYFIPQNRLYQNLCQMMNLAEDDWDQVRASKSYVLRVTLDLENYNIYRLIEAPAQARFYQLHKAIQRSFGWLDYHLHMFTFYDGEVEARQNRMYYGKKREMVILDHEDTEAEMYFDPEEQAIQKDRSLLLSDIFEERNSCVYSYDFGDDWEHVIKVEERKMEGGSRRFVLLDRQGERPPEDVGGEGGFEEYMRIISSPDDPEYDSMVRWAEITKAKQETIEEINRKLGYLM